MHTRFTKKKKIFILVRERKREREKRYTVEKVIHEERERRGTQ